MLLGGLWHGAGWTFVVWGALHGLYLVVNHAWHAARPHLGLADRRSQAGTWLARATTLPGDHRRWVIFRSDRWNSAWLMLRGIDRANGIVLSPDLAAWLGAQTQRRSSGSE